MQISIVGKVYFSRNYEVKEMTEFNLSEKIERAGCSTWNCKDGFIDVEDVKEFIRLLKKELEPINTTQEKVDWIMEQIDKLVGDKLK